MLYYLVALTILAHNNPRDLNRLSKLTLFGPVAGAREVFVDYLEVLALEVCGIAFTSDSPALLANSFGAIYYCESNYWEG